MKSSKFGILEVSHPIVSVCSVDKNYLKWWEIQLAINCGVGSLTDFEKV